MTAGQIRHAHHAHPTTATTKSADTATIGDPMHVDEVTSVRLRRLAALLGAAGPVVFTLGRGVGQAVQDGRYDPGRDDISDLGALTAQHPWVVLTGQAGPSPDRASSQAPTRPARLSRTRKRSAASANTTVAAPPRGDGLPGREQPSAPKPTASNRFTPRKHGHRAGHLT